MSRLWYITLLGLLIILSGCDQKFHHRSFYQMGTLVELTLPLKNETLVKEVHALIKMQEINVTTLTEQINHLPPGTPNTMDATAKTLLKMAAKYHQLSNGTFDITMAGLTRAYGFPEGPFQTPPPEQLQQLKAESGFHNLIIEDNTLSKATRLEIDTGAFSKGWIVDEAVKLLKSKSQEHGIVNAGGDLYALGTKNGKPWRIAIKHPIKSNRFLNIVALSDKALATSGNYERYFESDNRRITHIFNGITGNSANTYQSISVLADTVAAADGLATVYFLSTIDEIKSLCQKEKTPVLIYTLDSKLIKLCGWEAYEASH